MTTPQVIQDIIASALALPVEQRLAVIDAIHVSLADSSIDHGPAEDADKVPTAWNDEIRCRISDIDNRQVKTIPAEEAERMIRSDDKRSV